MAVKVAKYNHDMRFDIPCLGPQTLKTCADFGVAVLALESGKTLLLEKEVCSAFANRNRLSVITLG